MKVVDTNVLLNAVNRDAPANRHCAQSLEMLVNSPGNWALTWGIAYEFLRVATHPRVFAQPLRMEQALAFLVGLLSRPNAMFVAETPAHLEALQYCRARSPRLAGNILHDFHTAVLMHEHGIPTIVTLDADFRSFPWVTVESPA